MKTTKQICPSYLGAEKCMEQSGNHWGKKCKYRQAEQICTCSGFPDEVATEKMIYVKKLLSVAVADWETEREFED